MATWRIEYVFGKAKLEFRRNFNDCEVKHLKVNVANSISTKVLPLERIRKFARRTRDYRLMYESVRDSPELFKKCPLTGVLTRLSDGESGFKLYEKMRNKKKEHRCMLTLDTAFIEHS